MLRYYFLNPSIKRVVSIIYPPFIGLAVDNSKSIVARDSDSLKIKATISKFIDKIKNEDFSVEVVNMNSIDSIQFNNNVTNISNLLSNTTEAYKDKNHVATILFTDGIYNRGISPLYKNYTKPIFTIGMGNTAPPKDIGIKNIRYNRITYNGNETPIKIELRQDGYFGERVNIKLLEKGKVLQSKNLVFDSKIEEVEMILKNEEVGLRHIIVVIENQKDESTYENNNSSIFLEVIEGAKKVLIVANSPHPDIKAIRTTLEKSKNYKTYLYIPAINPKKPTDVFDVIIYHGAFDSNLNYNPKNNPSAWYIMNLKTNISKLKRALPFLSIKKKSGSPDEVTGIFNKKFTKFKIDDVSIFENYPPIQVPFATYKINELGNSDILIYQRLGKVQTLNPLMVFFDDGIKKMAVLMGENIWKWKLQEAAINDNSENFDDFITKTVQFLSVKNKNERFRVNPRSSTFSEATPILFDVEVYDDIYERKYGNEISIGIINEEGVRQEFSFIDLEINSTFQAPNLPSGIYKYDSKVKIGDDSFSSRGEFFN